MSRGGSRSLALGRLGEGLRRRTEGLGRLGQGLGRRLLGGSRRAGSRLAAWGAGLIALPRGRLGAWRSPRLGGTARLRPLALGGLPRRLGQLPCGLCRLLSRLAEEVRRLGGLLGRLWAEA